MVIQVSAPRLCPEDARLTGTLASILPRFIRLRGAPAYLGMDKNRFNREVRPLLSTIRIGTPGVAFDRLDLEGAHWNDSPDLARRMLAAYRHWVPRFEAAGLIEAALPYVREDAKCALVSTMTALTSGDTTDFRPTDASQLRRETLAMIRSALRAMGDG